MFYTYIIVLLPLLVKFIYNQFSYYVWLIFVIRLKLIDKYSITNFLLVLFISGQSLYGLD